MTTEVRRNQWCDTVIAEGEKYSRDKTTGEVFHNDQQMCCPKCAGVLFAEIYGSFLCLTCWVPHDPIDLIPSEDQSW